MYLQTMTNEELSRYSDTAATTDLERELAKRLVDLMDEEISEEKSQDTIYTLGMAGQEFADAMRGAAVAADNDKLADEILDAVETFEKECKDAISTRV